MAHFFLILVDAYLFFNLRSLSVKKTIHLFLLSSWSYLPQQLLISVCSSVVIMLLDQFLRELSIICTSLSSRLLRRVARWKFTEVSNVLTTSIIRAMAHPSLTGVKEKRGDTKKSRKLNYTNTRFTKRRRQRTSRWNLCSCLICW